MSKAWPNPDTGKPTQLVCSRKSGFRKQRGTSETPFLRCERLRTLLVWLFPQHSLVLPLYKLHDAVSADGSFVPWRTGVWADPTLEQHGKREGSAAAIQPLEGTGDSSELMDSGIDFAN